MNSMIFSGKVMHARKAPVQHSWIFPFCFYAIDLDELEDLDRKVKGFGYNHWKPVSLRDSDYLTGSGSFREQLSQHMNVAEIDKVILITVARFMARVFNPVSFYYCLKEDGSPACMVAEVNNTFGERHLYVMPCDGTFPIKCRDTKQFHVSPFNNMDGIYEFTFSKPGDDLNISIRLVRDDHVVMDAAMWGRGRELTTANLWKTLLRHPFTAALTMPRILRQAALLYYKRKLPVYKHPAPEHPMTIKV
jgi:cyclopropane-fatty-acyl-phospholipid synthase